MWRLDRVVGPGAAVAGQRRFVRFQLDMVRTRLGSARDAGQVRSDAALDQVVELLFGPLYHRWLLRTGPLTDEYADSIVDLVVAVTPPSPRRGPPGPPAPHRTTTTSAGPALEPPLVSE
ncbi:TetR-like C-terminal domain-containing protein [Micromonospora sp. LOL_023]|uniref:TetR-like C-terminal domain-containing protein n=1 Tax=Micromonospora sp. LOL_023 TaxID=3345418 RepID=UPI003A8A729A